jgi:metal-sulfur cluster biosynthetic enzyme
MNIHNLTSEEQPIFELLKTVMDPEVAVNIADLGLIYEVNLLEDDKQIHIVMTLSTRGCPLGDTIMQNVEVVIKANYPEYDVKVELVWEPEWTPELITKAGKEAIGM